MITAEQAAKKGGDCGRNVTAVFQHLESGYMAPEAPTAPRLWNAVLGEAGQAAESIIDGMDEGPIAHCPAVVCGDESKAFERVSLIWLRKVMTRWGFPDWAKHATMALVFPGAVRQAG